MNADAGSVGHGACAAHVELATATRKSFFCQEYLPNVKNVFVICYLQSRIILVVFCRCDITTFVTAKKWNESVAANRREICYE